MTKWEYMAYNDWSSDGADFEDLGREGWELVSVAVYGCGSPTFWFKRPLASSTDRASSAWEAIRSGTVQNLKKAGPFSTRSWECEGPLRPSGHRRVFLADDPVDAVLAAEEASRE